MRKHTKDIAFKPIIIEVLFLVIGVALAFAANEYREYRGELKRSELALESVLEEIKQNRTAVEASFNYHAGLSDTLNKVMQKNYQRIARGQKKVDIDIRLFDRGFISPARVLSTSWEAAKSVNAVSSMNYKDVLKISRLYAKQDGYKQQTLTVGGVIYKGMFEEGAMGIAQNYENLAGIIGTFYWREKELLATYDETLSYFNAAQSNESN